MIAEKEILRRFDTWLAGQGETFTMENVVASFEELFPEVQDEKEAKAIMNFLYKTLTMPPRRPLSPREIKRRFAHFLATKPVGSEFTVEELVSEVFPDLDEATAREMAYQIADMESEQ